MCTAITYKTKDAYFGRTLDIECSYGEEVIVTPRNFALSFRHTKGRGSHCAIIGMGTVREGYPLYYDAANEYGLGMAGLNFPTNACYFPLREGKENVSPFELVPWILGQCKSVKEARECLSSLNLCNTPFSKDLPLSPLHWMIADKDESIVVESVADGLKIYENPVGVLTNNPPFSYHLLHLCDYIALSNEPPVAHFGKKYLTPYSRGMGRWGCRGIFPRHHALCVPHSCVKMRYRKATKRRACRGFFIFWALLSTCADVCFSRMGNMRLRHTRPASISTAAFITTQLTKTAPFLPLTFTNATLQDGNFAVFPCKPNRELFGKIEAKSKIYEKYLDNSFINCII